MQSVTFNVNFIKGYPIYKKDKQGNKTKEINYYSIDVLEVSKNKEGKHEGTLGHFFVSPDVLSKDDFDELYLFALIQVKMEIASMSSDNKRVVGIDLVDVGASDCNSLNCFIDC